LPVHVVAAMTEDAALALLSDAIDVYTATGPGEVTLKAAMDMYGSTGRVPADLLDLMRVSI
jgi:hypothetical protein